MSSDVAIAVENLSKCYQIYNTPRDRLKQFLLPRVQRVIGKQPRQYYHEFWALKDISFKVKKGETIGIIGRNGSGKSTLLQLICGILHPTSGSLTTHGRIAALLELGSGFNPEFTGRENVYMNASVLGLRREEVDQRFNDIVAFADIGEFVDQPVKTYSSGMYVRLAFAVQSQIEPDILIVDEALSVGDIRFQIKCLRAIEDLREKGTSILFVSHSPEQIKSICNRVIWIEKGSIKRFDAPKNVLRRYINFTVHGIDDEHPDKVLGITKNIPEKETRNKWVTVTEKYNTTGDNSVSIQKISVMADDNEILDVVDCEEHKLTLAIIVDTKYRLEHPLLGLVIYNSLNEAIIHFNTELCGFNIEPLSAGSSYLIKIHFTIPSLKPGEYLISLGIDDGFIGANRVVFHLYDAWTFSIVPKKADQVQAGYLQIDPKNIVFTIEREN